MNKKNNLKFRIYEVITSPIQLEAKKRYLVNNDLEALKKAVEDPKHFDNGYRARFWISNQESGIMDTEGRSWEYWYLDESLEENKPIMYKVDRDCNIQKYSCAFRADKHFVKNSYGCVDTSTDAHGYKYMYDVDTISTRYYFNKREAEIHALDTINDEIEHHQKDIERLNELKEKIKRSLFD